MNSGLLVSEIANNPLERAKASGPPKSPAFSANARLALGLDLFLAGIRNTSWKEAGEEGRKTRAKLMSHPPDFTVAVTAFFANNKGR